MNKEVESAMESTANSFVEGLYQEGIDLGYTEKEVLDTFQSVWFTMMYMDMAIQPQTKEEFFQYMLEKKGMNAKEVKRSFQIFINLGYLTSDYKLTNKGKEYCGWG
jgi:hypothetical protein